MAKLETALSEVDGGPVKLRSSVFWYFSTILEKDPDAEAVIVAHQNHDHLIEVTRLQQGLSTSQTTPRHGNPSQDTSCLRWTYRQLHNASLNLAAAFQQYDISTIVHAFPNSIEWSLISWTSKLGKYTQSALDVGLLTAPRADELLAMLQMLNADILVVPDAQGAAAADNALQKLTLEQRPKVKLVLELESKTPGWIAFRDFALSASPVSPELQTSIESKALQDDLSRVCDIMFTSGTTSGKPKGCPRTVAGILTLIACQSWGIGCVSEASKINDCLSFKHNQASQTNSVRACNALAGLNFRIIAPAMQTCIWATGGTIVMASAFPDFGALISAIPRFKIKNILMIPPGVHAIAAHPDFEKLDQTSIETLSLGGDIVTKATFEKAARLFPSAVILAAHGMTEGGSALYPPYFGRPGLEMLADVETGADKSDSVIRFHAGIASLGKVNSGTRIRIADEANKAVPRNTVGELHFCNPTFVRYYLNHEKPEDFYVEEYLDTEEYARHRHWFKTGDLGIIDDDGWVWILGRSKDIIKRIGVSVAPAALESSLNILLDSETAVVAHPHKMLGQVPIAVVRDEALKASKKSKADIEDHILEKFGRDHALGGVVTLQDIGFTQFPLNATGKILKRELMKPASAFLNNRTKQNGDT